MSATTQYEIRESRDALYVLSRRALLFWERLLSAGVLSAILGFITYDLFRSWWSLVISAPVAIWTFLFMDPYRAELKVTSKELRTTGNIGRRSRSGSRTVFAADINRLEFQNGTEWFATRRSGLYAVTAKRNLCVLPFIDKQQTAEIIKTVENRFPGLKRTT